MTQPSLIKYVLAILKAYKVPYIDACTGEQVGDCICSGGSSTDTNTTYTHEELDGVITINGSDGTSTSFDICEIQNDNCPVEVVESTNSNGELTYTLNGVTWVTPAVQEIPEITCVTNEDGSKTYTYGEVDVDCNTWTTCCDVCNDPGIQAIYKSSLNGDNIDILVDIPNSVDIASTEIWMDIPQSEIDQLILDNVLPAGTVSPAGLFATGLLTGATPTNGVSIYENISGSLLGTYNTYLEVVDTKGCVYRTYFTPGAFFRTLEITDEDIATSGGPIREDIGDFVSTNYMHNNEYIYYIGNGSNYEPDYVWKVGANGDVICIEKPDVLAGNLSATWTAWNGSRSVALLMANKPGTADITWSDGSTSLGVALTAENNYFISTPLIRNAYNDASSTTTYSVITANYDDGSSESIILGDIMRPTSTFYEIVPTTVGLTGWAGRIVYDNTTAKHMMYNNNQWSPLY